LERPESGAGGEVVDVGELLRGFREDQVIARMWRDVTDPVGGGGPVVVGAAAVPGGDGRGETGFQAIEAKGIGFMMRLRVVGRTR
jgi:hypothetical protein